MVYLKHTSESATRMYNQSAVAIMLGSTYHRCETEKRKLQISNWIRYLDIYPDTLSKL